MQCNAIHTGIGIPIAFEINPHFCTFAVIKSYLVVMSVLMQLLHAPIGKIMAYGNTPENVTTIPTKWIRKGAQTKKGIS